MKRNILILVNLLLLSGCSVDDQVDVTNNQNNQLNIELEQLKTDYELLSEKYNNLLIEKDELLDNSLFLIQEGKNYSLFSKRQYADEIKENQYIIPLYEYNGVQNLQLHFDSDDTQCINEKLNKNENGALDIYKLNSENSLQEAAFLWYDVEENESILSVNSNCYIHVLDAGRPGISYEAYNFNVQTGELLSNEEFFQILNIDINLLCEQMNQYFNKKHMFEGENTIFKEPLNREDLLSGSYGFISFSLLEDNLVVSLSVNASQQYAIEETGKFSIPLNEIIKKIK